MYMLKAFAFGNDWEAPFQSVWRCTITATLNRHFATMRQNLAYPLLLPRNESMYCLVESKVSPVGQAGKAAIEASEKSCGVHAGISLIGTSGGHSDGTNPETVSNLIIRLDRAVIRCMNSAKLFQYLPPGL